MEITETTFYRWKKKCYGLGVSELRELAERSSNSARRPRAVAPSTARASCRAAWIERASRRLAHRAHDRIAREVYRMTPRATKAPTTPTWSRTNSALSTAGGRRSSSGSCRRSRQASPSHRSSPARQDRRRRAPKYSDDTT